ncbi:MAG: hypothetical protein MUC63_10460 [Planctomycetes bacterium]|jgi:hypothetical protein|nr:hypothetical protein [Planctomycetota bacterium]
MNGFEGRRAGPRAALPPRARRIPPASRAAALLTAALCLLAPAPAALAGDASVSATLGYDGRYRSNTFTPLRVTIENHGEERWFELRVPLSGFGGAQSCSARVKLPKGARRSYEFAVLVPVALHSGFDTPTDLTVFLAEEGGRNISETLVRGDPVPKGALVLVCGRLRDLAPLEAPQDATVVRIRPDELPEAAEALEGVTAVVLPGSGDFLRANPAKAAALRRWIRSGGTLVAWGLGTPPEGWDGFVPATAGAAQPVLPALTFDECRVYMAEGKTPPAAPRLKHGRERILLGDLDGALCVRVREGIGAGVFLALDPGAIPFKDESVPQELWNAVLTERPPERERHAPWESAFSNGLCNRSDIALPGFGTFLALFLGFAVLVGPGVSIAVGRKRGPWIWVAVAAGSGLLSAGLYVFALHDRPGDPGVRQLTIVDCTAEGEAETFTCFFGLFSPERRRYDLAVDSPAASAGRLSHQDRYYGRGEERDTAGALERDLLAALMRIRMDAYSARAFRAAGLLMPAAAERLKGGFALERESGTRLRIRNRSGTAFRGIWLLQGKGNRREPEGYRFPAVEPGEEAVSAEIRLEPPTALRNPFDWRIGDLEGSGDPGDGTRGSPFAPERVSDIPLSTLEALGAERGFCPFGHRIPEAGEGEWLLLALASGPVAPVSLHGRPEATEETVLVRTIVREGR